MYPIGQNIHQSQAANPCGRGQILAHFVVRDLVRHAPVRPLKVYMDAGRYEWLLKYNQRMRGLLVARGYKVKRREYNAGHHFPAWRDELSRGGDASTRFARPA